MNNQSQCNNINNSKAINCKIMYALLVGMFVTHMLIYINMDNKE